MKKACLSYYIHCLSAIIIVNCVVYLYHTQRGGLLKESSLPTTDAEESLKLVATESTTSHGRKTIYSPWPDDPNCSTYVTKFGENLPFVPLVSYPRSGNSWLRYLVESASGIFTGSVYNASDLKEMGYLGEGQTGERGNVLLVKTHSLEMVKDRIANTTKLTPAILLLRNPAASLLSHWDFVISYTKGQEDQRLFYTSNESSSFTGKLFRSFVRESTKKWTQLAVSMLTSKQVLLHVILYEDLVKEPLKEIRFLMMFLQRPVEERRLKCVASHLEGNVKRNHTKMMDPFTKEEKRKFKLAESIVNRFLKERGFNIII